MYRSLTILGADDEAAARRPDRLAKLADHRTLLERNMAILFAAIFVIGIAWILIMLGLKTGAGWVVYAIAALVTVWGLFRARRRWTMRRLDVVRLAATHPHAFAFAHAKITGFTIRKEGSGQAAYDVADATVAFEPGDKKETIQLVETFDNRIWHFDEGVFPIAARVVYATNDPTAAALISMAQAAINRVDPKQRVGSGDGTSTTMAVMMMVLAVGFLCLSIWISVDSLTKGHRQ